MALAALDIEPEASIRSSSSKWSQRRPRERAAGKDVTDVAGVLTFAVSCIAVSSAGVQFRSGSIVITS
jgi:hypothetical protein